MVEASVYAQYTGYTVLENEKRNLEEAESILKKAVNLDFNYQKGEISYFYVQLLRKMKNREKELQALYKRIKKKNPKLTPERW